MNPVSSAVEIRRGIQWRLGLDSRPRGRFSAADFLQLAKAFPADAEIIVTTRDQDAFRIPEQVDDLVRRMRAMPGTIPDAFAMLTGLDWQDTMEALDDLLLNGFSKRVVLGLGYEFGTTLGLTDGTDGNYGHGFSGHTLSSGLQLKPPSLTCTTTASACSGLQTTPDSRTLPEGSRQPGAPYTRLFVELLDKHKGDIVKALGEASEKDFSFGGRPNFHFAGAKVTHRTGTHRALMFMNDEYPIIGNLRGVRADLDVLEDGFARSGIKTDVERNVTAKRAVDCALTMLNEMRAGDTATFVVAGHGDEHGNLMFPNLDADDGYDCLAPSEVNLILSVARQRGIHCVFMADACFSGHMVDAARTATQKILSAVVRGYARHTRSTAARTLGVELRAIEQILRYKQDLFKYLVQRASEDADVSLRPPPRIQWHLLENADSIRRLYASLEAAFRERDTLAQKLESAFWLGGLSQFDIESLEMFDGFDETVDRLLGRLRQRVVELVTPEYIILTEANIALKSSVTRFDSDRLWSRWARDSNEQRGDQDFNRSGRRRTRTAKPMMRATGFGLRWA